MLQEYTDGCSWAARALDIGDNAKKNVNFCKNYQILVTFESRTDWTLVLWECIKIELWAIHEARSTLLS